MNTVHEFQCIIGETELLKCKGIKERNSELSASSPWEKAEVNII